LFALQLTLLLTGNSKATFFDFRVLLGLLNEYFTDFVRVGSLKKISKSLLDHTLQSVDGKEAIKELNSMLKDPSTSPEDAKVIK
jgi:hypothetical protein